MATKRKKTRSHDPVEEFTRRGKMKPTSILGEYFYFLKTTGKWWMLPLLVMILLFGLLIMVAGTGAAPFIYTLF